VPISVFKACAFSRYLGHDGDDARGSAWIARLIGSGNRTTMAGGVVVYEGVLLA